MTPERKLLAKLWALLKRSESCPNCLEPRLAFDECHMAEWAKLDREVTELLAPKRGDLN